MELRKGNKIVKCDKGFSIDILIVSYVALLFRKNYMEFIIFALFNVSIWALSMAISPDINYFYKSTIQIVLFNIILAIYYNKVHIMLLLKRGWKVT